MNDESKHVTGPMPRLSIVIVSYQVRELLRRCLQSVAAQRGLDVEILVVDNASTDGSADMVAREFPSARLIRNHVNVGFASANNQALELASGDPLLLLNPDTELPADASTRLIEVFRRHPNAGAVGFALVKPDGSPQPACYVFPGVVNMTLESAGLHWLALRAGIGSPSAAPIPPGGEGEVDWVAGACLAISRAAFERVGGLDPDSFMYGEEMDWSWRARALGLRTVFSSAATVLHHGGASGAGARGPLFVQHIEARLRFLRRYRGAWRAAVARELVTFGAMARLIYWGGRAALESLGVGPRQPTRDQIERFRAVIAWRLGRAA